MFGCEMFGSNPNLRVFTHLRKMITLKKETLKRGKTHPPVMKILDSSCFPRKIRYTSSYKVWLEDLKLYQGQFQMYFRLLGDSLYSLVNVLSVKCHLVLGERQIMS